VIVEDGPINSALGASVETKHHSAPGTGLSGKTKSRDGLGKNRVRGKVKEFVQIFNQEVPEKPSFDLNDSQHQDSRRKERSKFRTEDTINEKMHSNIVYEKNMPKSFNPGYSAENDFAFTLSDFSNNRYNSIVFWVRVMSIT
jgi:hypothetical protein